MSIPNHKAYDGRSLPVDRETWWSILESASRDAPETAEVLAHALFAIKASIESGADGLKGASETLSDGIEVAYVHTNAHRAALRLYVLSLTGHLKPGDEPLQLIGEAIKRGTADVARASAAVRAEKGRPGGRK